jgi:hypothetical protein
VCARIPLTHDGSIVEKSRQILAIVRQEYVYPEKRRLRLCAPGTS